MPDEIRDNKAESRFEMDADGELAVVYYKREPGIITFTHTETLYRLQGQGIASRLVRGALNAARAEGLKIAPRCSFVSAYMARHPEFNDFLL